MNSWSDNVIRYKSMVADAFPQFETLEENNEEEEHDPNPDAQSILEVADQIGGWLLNANPVGEVVVQDETYQNVEEIPVRPITETEIPEILRSPVGAVDIVNVELPNTGNEDESAQEEENSEDNDSATYDSRGTRSRYGDRGMGIGGRRCRPRKRTDIPLDLREAEAKTSTPPATSTLVVPTPSLLGGPPAMRMMKDSCAEANPHKDHYRE
ncbi:hypothetical protein PIB30_059634 [Stylosanthes scabra]|uniref:Uncharacterized protein n=1 Tax=Stylosanthes scabra TaxID=79078 RepID=A0ABU6VKJ8_9FABA|nr:hypothetical protein [Stylosanthes scabra]